MELASRAGTALSIALDHSEQMISQKTSTATTTNAMPTMNMNDG